MTDAVGESVVRRARDAASQGDWGAAFELFMKADVDGLVDPGDLAVLGEVAYAAGHFDVTIEAWERAYALCVEAGEKEAAAGAAVRVAMHLLFDTALMAPVRDPLRSLVFHAADRAVTRVLVAGETVARDGRPTRLDVAGAAGILAESQARMLHDAGLRDYRGRDGDSIAPLSLGFHA